MPPPCLQSRTSAVTRTDQVLLWTALCVPSMGELQMGFESPVGIPENMKCQNHYLKPTREG